MDHRKINGALPKQVDLRDYKIAMSSQIEFPEEFELQCGKVKDQGSINSCVAHVAAEIEEYFDIIQNNDDKPLSPGFIYGTRYVYKDHGMYLRDALRTLYNKGICYHSEFPYNKEVPEIIELLNKTEISKDSLSKHKITSYYSIDPNSINQIKQALYLHGPVMVSVKWYDEFRKLRSSKMYTNFKGDYGYHCIMIYGWNKDGFKIMNSWGEDWGYKGKAVYPYEYPIEEAWGITDTEVSDDIVKTKRNSFLDIIYKLLNAIINLLRKK